MILKAALFPRPKRARAIKAKWSRIKHQRVFAGETYLIVSLSDIMDDVFALDHWRLLCDRSLTTSLRQIIDDVFATDHWRRLCATSSLLSLRHHRSYICDDIVNRTRHKYIWLLHSFYSMILSDAERQFFLRTHNLLFTQLSHAIFSPVYFLDFFFFRLICRPSL